MSAKGVTVHNLALSTHIARITLRRRLDAIGPGFTADELAAIAHVLGTTPSELARAAESAAA
jgi:hypothetical protein